MAKKKKDPKAKKTVPVHLTFQLRAVPASPTTLIAIERILKFAVIEVQRRIFVVPLLDACHGPTGCYVYPAGTTPRDAVKKTIDSLWNRAVSGFIRDKDKGVRA